jgi:oligopeptide/dipeptide ABC transporter ATP-binding protein
MNTPLLSVRDLHVEIDTSRGLLKAIRGVSLDVNAGDSLGIVGESGSGKSITLKAIMGLLPKNARVTSGEIYVDGVDLATLSEKARRALLSEKIGIVFQDAIAALNPVMRVGAQIAETPHRRLGWTKDKSHARAIELMELVGIPEAEKRFALYPHQLSGGLRQRVAIAIALSGSPQLIFCDEPTTALDVTIQAQVLRLLMELRVKERTGLVFVTHDLAVVNEICDEIRVMYAGRFVESGSVANTFQHPSHPYTYSLLKSAPDVDHQSERLFSISGETADLTKPVTGCPFAPRCFAATQLCSESEPALLAQASSFSACHHAANFTEKIPADHFSLGTQGKAHS